MISLGIIFALCSATSFGLTNAIARRGMLSGSPFEAMIIAAPIGSVVLFIASWLTGQLGRYQELSPYSVALLAFVGLWHFIWGRYWLFTSIQALGSNLSTPIQQANLLVTLLLSVLFLNESLNQLGLVGIVLIMSGPLIAWQRQTNNPNFTHKLKQGYLAGALCGLAFGTSPILIRLALREVPLGILGAFISYVSATLMIYGVLLFQRRLGEVFTRITPKGRRWFTFTGLSVAVSQLFRYMALAIGPVVVVSPLQRLSVMFRLLFSQLMNRKYEVLTWRVLVGIGVSFVGGVLLALQ